MARMLVDSANPFRLRYFILNSVFVVRMPLVNQKHKLQEYPMIAGIELTVSVSHAGGLANPNPQKQVQMPVPFTTEHLAFALQEEQLIECY